MARVTSDRLVKHAQKKKSATRKAAPMRGGRKPPPKKGSARKVADGGSLAADVPAMGKTVSIYEKEREAERKEHGGFEKYEVEEWARSLEKAAEVINDPKKMAAVTKILDKKEAGIQSVRRIKELSKQYALDEQEP